MGVLSFSQPMTNIADQPCSDPGHTTRQSQVLGSNRLCTSHAGQTRGAPVLAQSGPSETGIEVSSC